MKIYPYLRQIFISALLASVVGLFYFFLATTEGLQSLAWIAENWFPNHLQIGEIHGTLTSEIDIRKFSFQDKEKSVVADEINFAWQPLAALKGKYIIDKLIINNLTYHSFKKSSSDTESFDWRKLSAIYVGDLQLNNIRIDPEGITLNAHGHATDNYQLQWQTQIAANHLNIFLPNNLNTVNNATINAQGLLSGLREKPHLQLSINSSAITYNKTILQNLALTADINSDSQTASTLQIKLDKIQQQDYLIKPARIDLNFNPQQQLLNCSLAAGQLIYFKDKQQRSLSWQNSQWQAQYKNPGLNIQGSLILTASERLAMLFNFPNYRLGDDITTQKINGNLQFNLPSITKYQKLFSGLKNIAGRLQLNFLINGTVKQPIFTGKAELSNASADVKDLNISLRNIHVIGTGNRNNINWQGSLRSGFGTLNINGITQIQPDKFPTQLKLQGQNILVSNTPSYRITANPDLTLQLTNDSLTLTGSALIPTARLDFGELDNNVVTLTKDVVFVHDEKTTSNFALQAKLNLTLGDDVFVQYEGLKSQLKGSLLLTEQPNRPTLANGEIDFVDGKYQYQEQVLPLSTGSHISFTGGPIDDPNLAVQATKQVSVLPQTSQSLVAQNSLSNSGSLTTTSTIDTTLTRPIPVTVGVNVQGSAKSPQISLYAQPAILSQADILSYLLIGQPSNELNVANAQLLMNAASQLNVGTGQFNHLMQTLQNTFRLDQLSIQSTPFVNLSGNQPTLTQNTSVVLGKALSPKLYVNYSIGLVVPVNTLQIRYLLNKHWTLQSSSSNLANGIDLLYTLEKN